jgi:uncharacterized OB-fold protein
MLEVPSAARRRLANDDRTSMGGRVERLLPEIDDTNRFYWDAARAHRLELLRCEDCRTWVHPPRPNCWKCRSERLKPEAASGKGKVYSWSVMRTPGNPGFDHKLPYAVVVVEMDDQVGLYAIGNIDCPIEAIRLNLPVEVTYEKATEAVTLPQWRVATGAAR